MTRRRIITPSSPPLSRSIVPVDSASTREALVRRYRRALKDAERERRKIQVFEDEGKNAFATWHMRCFFRDLNEIREMHDRISHLRQILQAIELESLFQGISRRAVYPLIQKRVDQGLDPLSDEARAHHREHQAELERQRRERMSRLSSGELNTENEHKFPQEIKETLLDRLGHRVHALDPDDVEELFHDYLDAVFDRARAEREQERAREQEHEPESNSSLAESNPWEESTVRDPARVKRIYRELAFRLHPDLNPALTAREKTLWSEVQIAYESQDLERLEILQGLLENVDEASIEKISSLPRIMELTGEVLPEIRSLKNRNKSLRNNPRYHFWEPPGAAHQDPVAVEAFGGPYGPTCLGLSDVLRYFVVTGQLPERNPQQCLPYLDLKIGAAQKHRQRQIVGGCLVKDLVNIGLGYIRIFNPVCIGPILT